MVRRSGTDKTSAGIERNQEKMTGRNYSNIPMLPKVTSEILRLVDDPSSTVDDLKGVIAHDPGLSCRILRVVNSSFYGLSRQIGSLERAIPILGLRVTRNLAIIASMDKFFQIGRSGDIFRSLADDLWLHSVSTATAGKLIAEHLNTNHPDEFFLSGLIHDIGIVAELYMDRTALLDALSLTCPDISGVPERSLLEIERHVFGADHQTIGREMCEQWRFPSFLSEVTGYHHRPLDLPPHLRFHACVTFVADRMSSGLNGCFRLDLTSLDVSDDVLDILRLSRDEIQQIRDQLSEQCEEIQELYS